MQKIALLSMEEYNDLLQIQKEPDVILQKTMDNYKASLDEATKTIAKLEKELSMYVIGGAKPRNEPDAISKTAWVGNDTNRLKTYVQETNRLRNKGEDFSMWHVDNLAEELGRTTAAVKSKARSLGYRVSKGYIVK